LRREAKTRPEPFDRPIARERRPGAKESAGPMSLKIRKRVGENAKAEKARFVVLMVEHVFEQRGKETLGGPLRCRHVVRNKLL